MRSSSKSKVCGRSGATRASIRDWPKPIAATLIGGPPDWDQTPSGKKSVKQRFSKLRGTIKLETLCTREAGRHAPFLRDKYLAMHVKAPSIRFGRQLPPNRTITQKANQGAQRRKRRDDAGRAPLAMAPLRLPSPFILSIGRCWLASTLVASSG